jgi:hypothetical protein
MSAANENEKSANKEDGDGKKKNHELLAIERINKRLDVLTKQNHTLKEKMKLQQSLNAKAQLAESYLNETCRSQDEYYRSLSQELKHRDASNKAHHSQIARLERQVANLSNRTANTQSMVDLLPGAMRVALDKALEKVDADEQEAFTNIQTSGERLNVLKRTANALDKPRVTILVKNVDPGAPQRSKIGLTRRFICTNGLTFQDLLEDCLRFWNLLPGEEEEFEVERKENISKCSSKNRKYCLADEGGALRLGHQLIENEVFERDTTKDGVVLSYLLFSLPKVDLTKVLEFSENFDSEDVDYKSSTIDSSVGGDSRLLPGTDIDDDIEEISDESHVDFFRYDAILSSTPLLVKDLSFYLVWLFVWITMSLVRRSISQDNQVSLLSKHWLASRNWDGDTQDMWTNFSSITTTDEWWSWVQGPVTLTMTGAHGMSKAVDFGGSEQGEKGGNAGGAFVLHGGWRLRQSRVGANCYDSLSPMIYGKSIKNDPKKKLENVYGVYNRMFCYSKQPYGPLFNQTDQTIVSVKHITENVVNNQSVYTTTVTEHKITKMTETPDASTIALKYASYNPFKESIKPNIDDPDTIAWLKAFLFYPAPTVVQSIENSYMGPYKDYRNPDYFDTDSRNGQFSDYGGSGYVLELPANLSSASVAYRLQKLKENNWIDQQTRSVVARANFYNVNKGQWAVVDALTEWDQSGKIKTLFKTTAIMTDQYATANGKLGVLLSVVVFLGALSFLYQQVNYWKVVHRKLVSDTRIETIQYMKEASCPVTMAWLSSVWTLIELGVLVPCLIARVLDIVLLINSKRNFPLGINYYRNLTYLAWLYEDKLAIDSLGYVFAFLKLFKYFAMHIKLQIIAVTISKASNLIVSWCVLFGSLFLSLAVVAHQTWGRQLEDFQSIAGSLRTMLYVMLGNIPYTKMYKLKPTFTPAFTVFFYVTINYVLLNLLVAILDYQYSEAVNVMGKMHTSEKVSKADQKRAKEMSVQAILNILCPFLAYRRKK